MRHALCVVPAPPRPRVQTRTPGLLELHRLRSSSGLQASGLLQLACL